MWHIHLSLSNRFAMVDKELPRVCEGLPERTIVMRHAQVKNAQGSELLYPTFNSRQSAMLVETTLRLAGQETADAVFVNTRDGSALAEQFRIRPRLICLDVTGRTLEITCVAAALSAGLGAVAARFSGAVSRENLIEAVREELACVGLKKDSIERNVQIAGELFDALPLIETISKSASTSRAEVVAVGYDGTLAGTPSVFDAGNADQRNTGAWRLERPVVDRDLCTRCGLCFVMCPDTAIGLDREGFPVVDYDHCKGCMICRELCPLDAISTVKETEAWQE